MLKFYHSVCQNKALASVIPKENPFVYEKKREKSDGRDYKCMDSSFRKEVDTVALTYFSQQKLNEEKPRSMDQEVSYPSNLQTLSTVGMGALKQENKQYKAWMKNIQTVLQELEKESPLEIPQASTWEKSIKIVLQGLHSENNILMEENEKKKEKTKLLLDELEEIKKENYDIMHAIVDLALLEPQLIDTSTEIEDFYAKLMRRDSIESGYGSEYVKESDASSRSSSCNSFSSTEKEALLKLLDSQKLTKKNNGYKTRINALEQRFDMLSVSKNELLDLKWLSFQGVELIKQNKEQEKRIHLLEAELTEAKEDNFDLKEENSALRKANLWKKIYEYQLDIWQESACQEQIELKSIEASLKKIAELNTSTELFTMCLNQTKKLISLLKFA